MAACSICGRAPCRSPAAYALLKPATFRRNERARRDKQRATERQEAAVMTQFRTVTPEPLRRQRARIWNGEGIAMNSRDLAIVRARIECTVIGVKPVTMEQANAALDRIAAEPSFDLVAHLHRQRDFSSRTFGPGTRTAGVIDHIRKELREIEAAPADLSEWIDVVLLALDGAWRAGHEPEQIAAALTAKQAKNEARTWPDWRTQPTDKAIEHKR